MSSERNEQLQNTVVAAELTPLKPLEQIAAERQADRTQLTETIGSAEAIEDRKTQIGEYWADLATSDPEGQEHLTEFLESDAFPDAANECLYNYECGKRERQPEYDITQEAPRRLAMILKMALRKADSARRAEAVETAVIVEAEAATVKIQTETHETETSTIVASMEGYKAAVESLGDLPNDRKINALLNGRDKDGNAYREMIPPSEVAKLQAFARILTISQQFPEDAPIIQQRFNQLDLSQNVPSHVSFIQTAIFSSPEHNSGVSDAMQQAVAAEFKLTPRRIVTGSDYEGAMGETTTDAEGSEVPVFSEDKPLEFGLGIAGYPSPNGEQQFMKASPTHGQAITLDVTSLSPAAKGVAASYLGMWKAAEDAGETDFFLSLAQYDVRGQAVLDEAALYRAARLANHTFGGRTGYDGEIVRGNDAVGLIRWQAQLRSPKGDAGRSDRNASDTRANMQGLGIMDAEGRIDEDVLEAFGDYSRDNWFGAPEYEDVRTHLRALFPDKIPEAV